MKTANYTFTTWDNGDMAAGFDSGAGEGRQAAMVRQPEKAGAQGGDKIIDLSAWLAANPDESRTGPQEELDWEGVEPEWAGEEPPPAPRPRRSRRAVFTAELISTLCVVAVAVVLIVRVLTF